MIIPSIDIENGSCVQLIGGEELAIDAGPPGPILERFAVAGEVAVIDLDAAKGEGSNRALIQELCKRARVRVGGGIRDFDAAIGWLNAGAAKIIIGTAATPSLLERLPKERVIVALDARDGSVVTHGWRTATGVDLLSQIEGLRDSCTGFLVTFVEREGRLGGTDMELAAKVIAAAGSTPVTIAGGVSTAEEIRELDRLGADAQVGMAIYSKRISLAQAIAAPLTSDRADGLWPTVVVDESGVALGLAYSSPRSLDAALDQGRGVYESRRRGLWVKGESSGCTQELLRVDVDCDRDTLRFTVRQRGAGFCHQATRSCWGQDRGLGRLQRRLVQRIRDVTPGVKSNSVTQQLAQSPALLRSKLIEEAAELGAAQTPEDVRDEAADLLYFALTRALVAGVDLAAIEAELDRRELLVTRRACEAKVDA